MTASLLLLVASLAFLILEVFVVSFGALSVVAVGCGIGSIVFAFQVSTAMGWTMVGVLVVGGPVAIWGAFKLLPLLPFARGFYLRPPKLSKEERTAAARPSEHLLGAIGTATSQLRPAGSAEFDRNPVQVVSTGSLIEPGTKIRVVSVTGNRVVVEEAE